MYNRLTSQVLCGDGRLSKKVALAAAHSKSTAPTPIRGRAALPSVRSSGLGTRARALPDRSVARTSGALTTSCCMLPSSLEAVHRKRGRVRLGRLGIEGDTV